MCVYDRSHHHFVVQVQNYRLHYLVIFRFLKSDFIRSWGGHKWVVDNCPSEGWIFLSLTIKESCVNFYNLGR